MFTAAVRADQLFVCSENSGNVTRVSQMCFCVFYMEDKSVVRNV